MHFAILNAVPSPVALLDPAGVILSVNDAWRNALQSEGFQVGKNYLEVCESAGGGFARDAEAIAGGIRGVLRGDVQIYRLDHKCHTLTESRWYRLTATRMTKGAVRGAVIVHNDVTEWHLGREEALRHAARQKVIARIGVEASRATSLEGILEITNRATADVLEVELFEVLRLSPDGSSLRLFSGFGWTAGLVGRCIIPVDVDSHTEFVLQSDEPVHVENFSKESRFSAPALLLDHDVVSGLSVTIRLRGEPWGILGAHSREERFFNEEDIDFIKSVAALLAVVIERLAFQNTLSESEGRMRDAQRIAHLGSWELDIAKNRLTWSDEVFRIFGADPADFTANLETFLSFVHPDDLQRVMEANISSINEGKPLGIEHRIIRRDGEIRHVCERGELIRDENGEAVVFAGTVLDITDLSVAHNRVEKMTALLGDAQQIANLGCWEMDMLSQRLTWSEETCRLFGISADAFGETFEAFLEFVLPEDRPACAAVHAELSPGQPLLEFDYRIRRPDGEVRWLFERGKVVTDAGGQIIRRLGVVMDVTERKRTEQIQHWEARVMKAISSGMSLPAILEMIAVGADEAVPGAASSILLLDAGGIDLRHGAAPHLPADFNEAVAGLGIGSGVGSCGAALHRREPVITVDIEADPSWKCVTDLASQRGLRACWAFPVMNAAGQPVASFALYFRECRAPAERDLDFIRRTVNIVEIAIARNHRERELRLLETCVSHMNDMVVITEAEPLDHPGPRIVYVNDAFVRRTGYTRAEVMGRSPRFLQGSKTQWDALKRIRTALKKRELVREELINYTKSGEEFWLEIEIVPVADANGWVTHFVAIERDITERKKLENEKQSLIVNLGQRLKELRALQEASILLRREDLAITELLGRIATLIPQAMQYPENAAALVAFGDEERATANFRQTPWMLEAVVATNDGILCRLRVAYLEPRPLEVEVAFLEEERNMIDALAEMLCMYFDRSAAANALRESKRRQQLILDSVGEGIYGLDLEGRIIFQNPAGLQMLGWSESELIGQHSHSVIHHHRLEGPEYPACECPLCLTLQDGQARHVEGEEIFRKDGSSFPVEYACAPIRDEMGLISGAVLSFRDISKRREVARELAATNRALRMLSSCSETLIRAETEMGLLHGICQIAVQIGGSRMAWVGYAEDDAEKRITPQAFAGVEDGYLDEVQVNWRESDLYGLGPAGQTIRQGLPVIVPDLQKEESFRPWLQPAISRGYHGVICLPLKADGHTFGLLGLYSPDIREMPEDELKLLQDLANDMAFGIITLRGRVERGLAREKIAHQAALLDKARDAIVVRDLEHRILYWNQSAERLYGWTAEEALGLSAAELLYEESSAFISATNATLESGEWVGEITQITKDGRKITIEGHWTLVRDGDGKPKSILAIDTDVSSRKSLERQFLRAQRMESIGTLAGGIAHDLNNVLAPILMSIDLLRIRESNPSRLEILSMIEASARRGADMVQQVLSFARGVEGEQLEVQVSELLREIEKIANETFLKNIQISSEIPANLWQVQGDSTQLHQVLLNLAVNARDAMPDGGKLTLAARNLVMDDHDAGMVLDAKPGPYVCIHVEDNGTGMPPDVLENIFEPFFTTKEVGKGTGLGLSTTTAIVKSHGGFLRVYSEVGMGTRFHIYFPAIVDSESLAETFAREELPHGNGELILVVDDEDTVREITRRTLETFGYRVLVASDGAEATAVYATHQPEIAVVLTDMMMPVMDGSTTIQVLLAMNPDVRIIAASGLNSSGMVAKAARVRHFLPKPYTAYTLLTTLRQALES